MAFQIVLPKLGLTMQEGVIGEWVAESGQQVTEGDTLFRVETDKVEVDVEAEAEGVLATVAEAGAVLPVGALVGWILADGEAEPDGTATPTPAPAPAPAPAPTDDRSPVDPAPTPGTGTPTPDLSPSDEPVRLKASPNARRVATAAGVDLTRITGTGPGGRIVSEDVEDHLATPAAATPVPTGTNEQTGRGAAFVGPLVRKLAAELGVDLDRVPGTGTGGRIIRSDVERAASGGEIDTASTTTDKAQPARSAPSAPSAGDVIPLRGMRGAIARNMMESLHTTAQLTHGYEVDVTALVAVRAALKIEATDSSQQTPSLNDFIVRAAALALREHPLLNAGIVDDEIVLAERIDVGIAVAVDGGLMVPVVRSADELPVSALGATTRRLAGDARSGRISPADLEGATFSVSTLGAYGVDFFTPVINPGNVAILGVGRVKDGVRWDGDTPARTEVLTLSLTFDHRAVDGAPAAEYLRTVGDILSRPLSLLSGS
ncbi:pyruvate dehydrogenase E2 component (dihydrolipoamide acetyltransferase) [Dietzia sp. 2505]|uniref:dihydrolipoamide acetyltransferase family protein n=1 Tax=Dietzia sp. 2505 TaxID=3156457 RepID=UPI0033969068